MVIYMRFSLDLFSIFRKENKDLPPWWIEVKTDRPACIYYFGPYGDKQEAVVNQQGFVEDLRSENAIGIGTTITRAQPEQLTIVRED